MHRCVNGHILDVALTSKDTHRIQLCHIVRYGLTDRRGGLKHVGTFLKVLSCDRGWHRSNHSYLIGLHAKEHVPEDDEGVCKYLVQIFVASQIGSASKEFSVSMGRVCGFESSEGSYLAS